MKKKLRLLLLVALTVVSTIAIGGCSKRPGEDGNLTDRQKAILESHFTTTNFDELSDEDKEKIICIEEMLQYMDDKYGKKEFNYRHYMSDEEGKSETLILNIDTEEEKFNSIMVTRKTDKDGKKTITDTYINEKIEIIAADYFKEFLKDNTDVKNYYVYTSVNKTELEKIPKKAKELDGNLDAHFIVYFDQDEISEDKLKDLCDEVEDWMKDHEIKGFTNLVVLKSGVFADVDQDIYSKYLGSDYVAYRETVYIRNEEATSGSDKNSGLESEIDAGDSFEDTAEFGEFIE